MPESEIDKRLDNLAKTYGVPKDRIHLERSSENVSGDPYGVIIRERPDLLDAAPKEHTPLTDPSAWLLGFMAAATLALFSLAARRFGAIRVGATLALYEVWAALACWYLDATEKDFLAVCVAAPLAFTASALLAKTLRK